MLDLPERIRACLFDLEGVLTQTAEITPRRRDDPRAGNPQGRLVLFEDALAGVEAGRGGRFGWVVGVDRTGQAEALRRRGAAVVVQDLAELLGQR